MPKKSRSKPVPADPLEFAVASALAGISKSKKLLVGVSGGRDSMVLLYALQRLGYRNLVVCHLDHMLRGKAAKADAAFVRRHAAKAGLALESARAQTEAYAAANKKSLELAARELRRAFFAECARKHRSRLILLAHHADDQIETCLFNFLRGSGPAGLAGIKTVSKLGNLTIHHPLLAVTRKEIDRYHTQHRIAFREDSTNAEYFHTRNKIRHEILPFIEHALGPSFRKAIPRAAEILRAEDEWMTSLVPIPGEALSCRELRAMPLALQRRLVRAWLVAQEIPEPGMEETQRVLSLLDTSGPAKINLPGDRHARRRAGILFLEKSKP
ncbi:MAG: tRNA lysidine(34) synthetase TilS [Verrucomicrobiota bacterium]